MLELGSKLDILLEEKSDSLYVDADTLSGELLELRRSISSASKGLSKLRGMLCGDLALEFRRRFPSLNVSVDGKRCKVGYRSKLLIFEPDILGKIWVVRSDSAFAKSFVNRYRRYLIFDSSCVKLVDVVGDYFASCFKSLNEEIEGSGVLIIGGFRGELSGLAELKSGVSKLLDDCELEKFW